MFEGLGELEGEFKIKLKYNLTSLALTVAKKASLPFLEKTKVELDRMLEMGVISRVTEPTQWSKPVFVLPKPGRDVRIGVDLTNVNAKTLRGLHPLPSVDYTLANLAGQRYSPTWMRTVQFGKAEYVMNLVC